MGTWKKSDCAISLVATDAVFVILSQYIVSDILQTEDIWNAESGDNGPFADEDEELSSPILENESNDLV